MRMLTKSLGHAVKKIWHEWLTGFHSTVTLEPVLPFGAAMAGQIGASTQSGRSEARVAHDVRQRMAQGSARFQRAVPGILPGTRTGDPRGQDHPSPCAPDAPGGMPAAARWKHALPIFLRTSSARLGLVVLFLQSAGQAHWPQE